MELTPGRRPDRAMTLKSDKKDRKCRWPSLFEVLLSVISPICGQNKPKFNINLWASHNSLACLRLL